MIIFISAQALQPYTDSMCGRYVLYETDELEERYGVESGFTVTPNYNASPTQMMPVVTTDGIGLMRWGLIPRWSHDERMSYKLFNARSESVFEKPMWRNLIKNQRCLVPANGFYEWQRRNDGKHPFYIHPKNEDIFSFAGLWETWKHEGRIWQTYSILTTEPNKEMTPIHNRMPLILRRDDERAWLESDDSENIEALMQPYQDGSLVMHEVGKDVNKVVLNNATLIGPLGSR